MPDRFATSQKRLQGERHLTFLVAPEAVAQHIENWSPPVRFKFETRDDDTVTMWLQNVEDSMDRALVEEAVRGALVHLRDDPGGWLTVERAEEVDRLLEALDA